MSNEEILIEEEVLEPEEITEGKETIVENKYTISAREQGWVPKEEWKGDPEDWTDAKEFIKRGELFGKISHQSGEIKELKKAMGALLEHHNKVKATEFSRALEYLKQQKKSALEEGDADKLLQVEDAIDTLKEEQSQQVKQASQPAQSQLSPGFVSWVNTNQWYVKDQEMRAFADDIGVGYYNRNKSATEAEVYEYVAKRVKQAYPEKFKGQEASRTPQVEGSSGSGKPGVKRDSYKLSEEEERVMKTFVRQGIMTAEQYKAELKRVKGEA